MTDSIPIDSLIGSVPCSQAEWEQRPSAVPAHLASLHTNLHTFDNQLSQLGQQVDQLQSRMAKTSAASSKPPASDSPFKTWKPHRSEGKRGGHKGHPGAGPKLLDSSEVQIVLPPSCSCGHTSVSNPTPDSTHQVLELPPIDMEVTPVLLHPAICSGCASKRKSPISCHQ